MTANINILRDSQGTRSESFFHHNRSAKKITQKDRAHILIIKNGPVTSRRLTKLMNTERSSINRTLKDLELEGKIKVVKTDKCQITGRRVNYYGIVEAGQTVLFPSSSKHWTV